MLGPGMTLVGTPVALSYSLRVLLAEGRRPMHVIAVILAAIATLIVVAWLAALGASRAGGTPTGSFLDPASPPLDAVSCDCEAVGEPARSFEMRLGDGKSAAGLVEIARPGARGPLFVERESLVTLDDIGTLSVLRRGEGTAALAVTLTPKAGDRLRRATGASLGRRLVILVDGVVVHESPIEAELGESFLILANLTEDDGCRLQCAVRQAADTPAGPLDRR